MGLEAEKAALHAKTSVAIIAYLLIETRHGAIQNDRKTPNEL